MVTLREIADKAGTSISTVSLVLSGSPRISAATRDKVLNISRELGYHKEKQSQKPTITIVLTDGTDAALPSIFQEAVLGVLDETMANGAVLQILRYEETGKSPQQLLRELRLNDSHGAVMIGKRFPEKAVGVLHQAQFPQVFVGCRNLPGTELHWIASDYAQGSRLATQHLLKLGHCKVAALQGTLPDLRRYQERLLGYRMAMADAGLSPIVFTDRENALPIEHWLQQGITAVFALSYSQGAQVLTSCRALGIAVPQELAVVTFDDDPSAELLSVPLTTVRQPAHELGVMAARTLLAWLRGAPRSLVQLRLQTQLIVRTSCGAQLQSTQRNGAAD
ncbi:MAG TPA: LacI family transcriptional regulator [Firmicutes bacterium]|nr:LacI family transcriptional regulator [Bacillota bacterium]